MRRRPRRKRPLTLADRCKLVLRLSAWVLLVCCVYCKMIDLDCALSQPMHCQSVLEAGDNSFGHLPDALPAIELAVVVLEPVQIPAPPCVPLPQVEEDEACWPVRPAWSPPQSSKRPPPFHLV